MAWHNSGCPSSSPIVKIDPARTVTGNEIMAPKVADFSSRGPSTDYPEIIKVPRPPHTHTHKSTSPLVSHKPYNHLKSNFSLASLTARHSCTRIQHLSSSERHIRICLRDVNGYSACSRRCRAAESSASKLVTCCTKISHSHHRWGQLLWKNVSLHLWAFLHLSNLCSICMVKHL